MEQPPANNEQESVINGSCHVAPSSVTQCDTPVVTVGQESDEVVHFADATACFLDGKQHCAQTPVAFFFRDYVFASLSLSFRNRKCLGLELL